MAKMQDKTIAKAADIELKVHHAYADEAQNVWFVQEEVHARIDFFLVLNVEFKPLHKNSFYANGVCMDKKFKSTRLVHDLGERMNVDHARLLLLDMRTVANGGWRWLLHDKMYENTYGLIHIMKPIFNRSDWNFYVGVSVNGLITLYNEFGFCENAEKEKCLTHYRPDHKIYRN